MASRQAAGAVAPFGIQRKPIRSERVVAPPIGHWDVWDCRDYSRVMPAAVVDCSMRTGVAATAPRKKGQKARVLTAPVDVALRLGHGTGTEVSDDAAIADMAGWLGLSAAVVERAKEVFRKVEGARAWEGMRGWTKLRTKDPLYAACLSMACRNEGSPRSLKDLASATGESGAAARAEIARLTKHFRRHLGEHADGRGTGLGVVRASAYLPHFCHLLGMEDREVAEAKEAARRLEESDLEVRHTGESVAAGVVCLALERADDDRPDILLAVATATGVSAVTVNNVCRKLRPHAELLFG